MNLLNFFKTACYSTRPGDVITCERLSEVNSPFVAALAKRMDFIASDDHPFSFINVRNDNSPVIGWLELDDFAAWHTLFKACFGHSISREQWAWKYRDCDHPGVGVWINGVLIAFYGGMPRSLACMGYSQLGIQVGDVMVHPDHRGSLSRKGPFQLAASSFLEQTLAKGAPYWLGFGFPNQRAMLVARKLRLYEAVDQLSEISWHATREALPWWQRLDVVDARDLNFIDGLWKKMVTAFHGSILGVRDSQYIRRRYLEHPTHRYQLIRLTQKLTHFVMGCIVVRIQTDNRLEVLDWIGPPKYFAHLIKSARISASRLGCSSAYSWITRSHEHLLLGPDATLEKLDVMIPTNAWVEGNSSVNPVGRWWLTSGDTDFR